MCLSKWPTQMPGLTLWTLLGVVVHSARMPIGFGLVVLRTNGRPLSVMVHLKRSVIEVKAESNSLTLTLITAIAEATNYQNYKAYREGRKIKPVVHHLLAMTVIDFDNGVGIP